jgi:hypothetical protein
MKEKEEAEVLANSLKDQVIELNRRFAEQPGSGSGMEDLFSKQETVSAARHDELMTFLDHSAQLGDATSPVIMRISEGLDAHTAAVETRREITGNIEEDEESELCPGEVLRLILSVVRRTDDETGELRTAVDELKSQMDEMRVMTETTLKSSATAKRLADKHARGSEKTPHSGEEGRPAGGRDGSKRLGRDTEDDEDDEDASEIKKLRDIMEKREKSRGSAP